LLPKSEAPFDALIRISFGSFDKRPIFWLQYFSPNYDLHCFLGTMSCKLAVPASGKLPFPPASLSRISPPVPVAAPLNGSTVVGKLCVSAFNEITVSISVNLEKISFVLSFGCKLLNFRAYNKCYIIFVRRNKIIWIF